MLEDVHVNCVEEYDEGKDANSESKACCDLQGRIRECSNAIESKPQHLSKRIVCLPILALIPFKRNMCIAKSKPCYLSSYVLVGLLHLLQVVKHVSAYQSEVSHVKRYFKRNKP